MPTRLSGPTLFLTQTGYMKNGWSILTGNELYLYQTKDALEHSNMHLVHGAKIIGTPNDEPYNYQNRIFHKLIVRIQNTPDVVMFFQKQDSCVKWHKALIKASGDYSITDFYEECLTQILDDKGTGTVYKGINMKTKQEVAIKRFKRQEYSTGIQIMRLAVHHYVARLLDWFESPQYTYLVLELEQGGTLLQYIQERNNFVAEQRCKSIAQKLAQGIEYLHEFGILICKLNLNTIMMTDNSDQAIPRINSLSAAGILLPS